MIIKGKVLSISDNVALVCIIRENTACGSCSTCPKKMGVQDTVLVAAIKGIQIGEEVLLCENKNWFGKNKIIFAVIAFVLGIMLVEAISLVASLGNYHMKFDLLGGVILTILVFIISWVKRSQYLFRLESIKGGEV